MRHTIIITGLGKKDRLRPESCNEESHPMSGKNQQLVADEPVEFEESPVGV